MNKSDDPKYYDIWIQMRARCNNPKNAAYKWYGERGIKVCERWNSFQAFVEDMGSRPDGMQIDRMDNDGDYEPSNCRWVTSKKNLRNTRRNRQMTAFGETKCMSEWLEDERCVVNKNTLKNRVFRGWPDEEAISTPTTNKWRTGRAYLGR